MFGYVQQLILSKFIKNERLRYSEAAPKEIDDDLYNYHLQTLIKKSILIKEGSYYKLSEKGKIVVHELDITGNELKSVKLGVLPFVLRDSNGSREILMEKRLRQPYFGDINPSISGKLAPAEAVLEGASRKLEEETDLICKFRLIGLVRKIRLTKTNHLFEDVLLHICVGENPKGVLNASNIFGDHFWKPINMALNLTAANKANSTSNKEILTRIEKRDFSLFYITEEATIDTL